MTVNYMPDWPAILSAFCGGLALTLGLAAQGAAPPRTGQLKGLAAIAASLALVISLWNWWGGAPMPNAGRAAQAIDSVARVEQPSVPAVTVAPPAASPAPSLVAVSPSASEADPPVPPRLRIPALSLDEPIITIPIRQGEWDLSGLGKGVGWLTTTGAHPGDGLAMVFVGHITLSAVERGPFAYLQDIKKGAEIIYSSAGVDYTYAVKQVSRAQPDDVRQLYLPDPNSLLLVTCTDWDGDQRVYAGRLLVRAVLVRRSEAGAVSQ